MAYFLSDISPRNYQNRFMYVKVIARRNSDIFETQCTMQKQLSSPREVWIDV